MFNHIADAKTPLNGEKNHYNVQPQEACCFNKQQST